MLRGGDFEVVRAFDYGCADFAEFSGHSGDAVGFLDAPVADVAEGGFALGEKGGNGEGHGGIGYGVQVQVEAVELAAGNFNPVGAAFHSGAHLLQDSGVLNVTLDAVGADAVNAHRAAGDCGG